MLFSGQPLSSRTIGGIALGLAVIIESKASNIALVSHTDWNGNTGTSTTSSAINTTGASLLVMSIGEYLNSGAGVPVPSDSFGNTWTLAIQHGASSGGNQAEYLFYAANPTVGTGHTFTCAMNQGYGSQQVAAFSGITTTSPLDQTSGLYAGSGGSASTIQPGSLTPAQDDCLIITNEGNFVSTGTGATASINLGFAITNQDLSTFGNNCGSALAYLVQATSAPINPTWTLSSTVNQFDFVTNLAVFKGVVATDTDTVNYTWFHGSQNSESGNATDTCGAGVVRRAVIKEAAFPVGFSGSALSSHPPGTSDGAYAYARDIARTGAINNVSIVETGSAIDSLGGAFDPTLGMFLLSP